MGSPSVAPAFNRALRTIPGVIIANWAAVVREHEHYVVRDGVHHKEAGRAAYRDLFLEAIASCGDAARANPSG